MTALGVLVCATWLYLLLFRGHFWWMRDGAFMPSPGGSSATVAAVIPARNEFPSVAWALSTLSAQRYPNSLAIILVDDHSTDNTAAIASRYATVIQSAPLPPGWTGKLWAVSQGIAQAGIPDYYLLTDADIVHTPDNLAESRGACRSRKLRSGLLYGHATLRVAGRTRSYPCLRILLFSALSASMDRQP